MAGLSAVEKTKGLFVFGNLGSLLVGWLAAELSVKMSGLPAG
jgi:hypothetical protein